MRLTLKNFKNVTALILLMISGLAHAQFWANKTADLLPDDQAFKVSAFAEEGVIHVNWSIAQDYYMYREQFSISSTTPGVEIGEIKAPKGLIEQDPEFGEVEVYFFNAELTAPITANAAIPNQVELVLRGQGCNKPVGVCYAPQTRLMTVAFESNSSDNIQPSADTSDSAAPSSDKSFWGYVVAALGAGILLSFTPCVLPMIPILAGVIAGQKSPSKLRSGWLATCYVGGTVVTYAIAGWVAGASGTQLQAHFQNPWVIAFICGLLILLAASLFGVFKIQLPNSLQTKLSGTSVTTRSASISSFTLGLISALVVGACVSPILIITLGAAISKGDPVLGAAIMSAMAIGMGMLLILFGFGAGWILPKTGNWMTQIQVVFGFMVLGVAIYIASSLPFVPSLYLWAGLLIWTGFYVWQIASAITAQMMQSVLRAVSAGTILWGVMALLGGATGGQDVLRPLDTLRVTVNATSGTPATSTSNLSFQTVTTLAAAQKLLADAKNAGKPALLDFYADWCLDCKRMHRTTFKEPEVISALSTWVLIEIDVTETSDDSEAAKRGLNVFGPPATLFYQANGEEHSNLRQYGYLKKDDFLDILERTKS